MLSLRSILADNNIQRATISDGAFKESWIIEWLTLKLTIGDLMNLKKTGKKVIIRPYQLSDHHAWKTAYLTIKDKKRNGWDISPKNESELTLSEFKKLLSCQKKDRDDDSFYRFGIFLKDGALVGEVSLMDISRQVFQNAYLGYRVFNNYWGMGRPPRRNALTLK